MTLQSVVLTLLKISIALSVFDLGLRATFADATYMFRHPRDLIRALLSMNVLMPLLALWMALTFNLNPAVKIALVALSVSPVPPIFPRKAEKAGGSDDYSVGLLVAASVFAIAVIPLTMWIFGRISNVPLQIPARSVAIMVFMSVLAPLLVGISVRAELPKFAETLAEPIGKWATALLILCAIPILVGSIKSFVDLVGDGTLVSFTAFSLAGYLVGDTLGRPEFEKRRVLGLATASRHPAIAIAIAHTNFPQQKLALPAIGLYLIVSAIVTGLASRRKPGGVAPTQSQGQMAA